MRAIVRIFPEAEKKLRSIPNAAGIIPLQTAELRPPKDYILFVGNLRSYKNPGVLFQAFSQFVKRNPSSRLKLIVAGNDDSSKAEHWIVNTGLHRRVEFHVRPSDEQLAALYERASVLVLPSNEEGFGIPVLEAMSFGVPTIVSDAPALIEVAGGASLVFPRRDPHALCGRIEEILSADRAAFAAAGRARAAAFSWDTSALELRRVYESLR